MKEREARNDWHLPLNSWSSGRKQQWGVRENGERRRERRSSQYFCYPFIEPGESICTVPLLTPGIPGA